jgi:hypothetical protein
MKKSYLKGKKSRHYIPIHTGRTTHHPGLLVDQFCGFKTQNRSNPLEFQLLGRFSFNSFLFMKKVEINIL